MDSILGQRLRLEAITLDAENPLRDFGTRFVNLDPGLVYLDGNSLGRMPLATTDVQRRLESEWGSRLIRGWNEGWLELNQRIAGKIGQLIGADADEVLVADSTSVNLYKLAASQIRASGKQRLLSDRTNFPSDLYILSGLGKLTLVDSPEDALSMVDMDMDIDTALASFSLVSFKQGRLSDLTRLSRSFANRGVPTLWDLSHAVGAVPINLNSSGAEMAVGCGYKYLNGGPGAPAFLYVKRSFQDQLKPVIQGWFGDGDPFAFNLDYKPQSGIQKFAVGTPPIMAIACMEPGIDLLLEAGMETVRRVSLQMTDFFIREMSLNVPELELLTPQNHSERASHVTWSHPNAWQFTQALIQLHNVIPDFRTPDCIRFGITPLYTTFDEIARAVIAVKQVVGDRQYDKFSPSRNGVT